jgi:hypothetical protein
MTNAHCRTWNKTKKQKIMENEKTHNVGCENGRNIEEHVKRETHTVGHGVWQET